MTKQLFLLMLIFYSAFIHFARGQCTISGPSDACENQVTSYTVPSISGHSYTWNATGGGTVIGSGNSVSVLWDGTGSGKVTLIRKDELNNIVCTASYPVTVHAKPAPVITPSFTAGCDTMRGRGKNETRSCFGACDSTYLKYFTPQHSGSTYKWTVSGPAVYTASGNSVTVFWTGTGPGNIKVKEINQWGCETETEVCVEVAGRPRAAFSAQPGISSGVINACKNQPIQFTNLSSPRTGKPITSFSWYFGDNSTDFISGSSTGNTSHAYASSGTFTVMLVTENECHCRDTAFVKVNIAENIGPDITCISTVCPGNVATYQTNATSCNNYKWTVGNGTAISSATGSAITVQWGSNGPGVLSLNVDCPGYCNAPTTLYVPVITPTAKISGPGAVCQYKCYTYKLSSDIPLDSIRWTIPDGVSITGNPVNTHEIQVCFNTIVSGNIGVEYFHKTPGSTTQLSCGGKAELSVAVRPTFFAQGSTSFCENNTFTYYAGPVTQGNILWTIHNASGTLLSSATLATGKNFTGTWTYGAGNFIVTATDVDGNFCNSPLKINITVHPVPSKPIVINGPSLICPGNSYSYSSVASSSALTMGWTATAGTPATSIGNSRNVTWDSSGSYNISVYQMDPVNGCKSDTMMLPLKSLLPLSPSPIIGPLKVCANSDINFSTTATGDDFEWSINSTLAGSVKSGQHSKYITVQWNNYTGNAWLVLKTSTCGSTRKDSVLITVSGPPQPEVSAPSTVCQGAPVTFSSSGAESYSWNFSDDFLANGSSVNHVFNEPGNYVISVAATYGSSCPGKVTGTKKISVLPKPDITISTPDPNGFCNPPVNTAMFVAAPVGSVDYQWYKPAIIPAATGSAFTATSPGSYFVTGTNSYGCKDTSNVIPVTVGGCEPCTATPHVLDFNRFRMGCNTDSFNFWSSAGVINHTLTFDDPFSSVVATSSKATHRFKEPGYYRIMLCADVPNTSNNGYCNTCVVKTDTVKYVPGFYDSTYCVNNSGLLKVRLVNTTKVLTGFTVPSWNWTINPGAITSTAQNPLVDLAPGTYTISLNAGGVCTYTKTIVIDALPVAEFTVADSICTGKPVIFTNSTKGLYDSSTWTFGDAASSLIGSPVRTYTTAGNYTVVLTVKNAYGCMGTANRTVTVLPNTLNGTITSSIPDSFCEGDSVLLKASASGGYPPHNYLWSDTQAGASMFANQTGSYYAELGDTKGCYFRTANVNVMAFKQPEPVITGKTSLCTYDYSEYKVNYPWTQDTKISWVLDGVVSGTYQYFNYYPTPAAAGNHTLVVNITDANGCTGSDTLRFSVYIKPDLTVRPAETLCAGKSNELKAVSSSSIITSYLWNNGLNTPVITTGNEGIYSVTVTDSNNCKATASAYVNALPDISAMMTGCYEVCDTVKSLQWHAPAGYYSYQWFMNDTPVEGATSSVFPVPLYKSGTYTLEVSTYNGCVVKSKPIEINYVKCGNCKLNLKAEADCGPSGQRDNQTFTINFNINNSLGTGAEMSVNSPEGTIAEISHSVLSAGSNTVTAVFRSASPESEHSCFNIAVYNQNQRCDTSICVQLPVKKCGPVFNNIADKEYYSIKIHPNPGDQETNISYKSSVTDARITFEIFDISGKVVYKSDMDSAGRSEFVNTSDFATGVYMVKIMLDGELSGIEKLMIAR